MLYHDYLLVEPIAEKQYSVLKELGIGERDYENLSSSIAKVIKVGQDCKSDLKEGDIINYVAGGHILTFGKNQVFILESNVICKLE